MPDSDIRGRIEDGVLTATLFTHGEMYALEPAVNYPTRPLSSHSHSHIIYRLSDVDREGHRMCGMDETNEHELDHRGDSMHGDSPDYMNYYNSMAFAAKHTATRRTGWHGDAAKTTCMVSFYADHRYFGSSQGGSSVVTTINNVISYVEQVTRIYKFSNFANVGQGIQIGIKRIVVFTASNSVGNFFTASTGQSSYFLDQLSAGQFSDSCLAHGLTNQQFANGVLGLANVGTICRVPTSGSVSSNGLTVYSFNTGITTINVFGSTAATLETMLVMAHEMGHNHGMSHDNSCGSYCSSHSGECQSDGVTLSEGVGGHYIMWPVSVDGSQSNNNAFSPCSLLSAGNVWGGNYMIICSCT